MKLNDVPKALGVSRITVYNYRKKLGILEETADEVSDNNYKKLKKLANSRIKRGQSGGEKSEVLKKARAANDSKGFLEVTADDSIQLINLKQQYNSNQLLINYLNKIINKNILENETPSKLESDMMEKYQKLNMQLAKTIESIDPAEENLAAMIKSKLDNYS